MQLAVATRSFLVSVHLDESWNLARFERLATGRHYGLALPADGADRILAISRDDDDWVVYGRDDDGTAPFGEIDRVPVSSGFDDIHQIAACDDGLYVANSGHNRLEWISLDGERRGGHVDFDEHGSRHVNSVFPCGPELAIGLLHNKSARYSEVALVRRTPDDLELVRRLSLWDTGCHNVYVDDTTLVYNASEIGDFVVVDLSTGTVRRRIHFPGHTKGLSVTDDWFVIGISEYASRWARNTTYGRLAVIDRDTLEVVTEVDLNHDSLPHPIGNVNEIRCVSEHEFGHAAPAPPPVELGELTFERGDVLEQLRLHLRRAAIETYKAGKTASVTVREGLRRFRGGGGVATG